MASTILECNNIQTTDGKNITVKSVHVITQEKHWTNFFKINSQLMKVCIGVRKKEREQEKEKEEERRKGREQLK